MDAYNDEDDDCFDASDSWNTSVRVYQPIQYGLFSKKAAPTAASAIAGTGNNDDDMELNCTFIGGARRVTGSSSNATPEQPEVAEACSICQDLLYPLVQYYSSIEGYTIQVSACNRPSCYRNLFPEVESDPYASSASKITTMITVAGNHNRNGLHYGGSGVVVARRILVDNHNPSTITTTTRNATTTDADTAVEEVSGNEWTSGTDFVGTAADNINGSTNNQDDDDDDDDNDLDMEELESKLAAIEARGSTLSSSVNKPIKKTNNKNNSGKGSTAKRMDGFPRYMLHGLQEPPIVQTCDEAMHDLDDVGLSGNTSSKNDQNKIQQMLQQYMEQMEDDVDMLNLLQQQQPSELYKGNTTKNDNNVQNMERDERLSLMDRALFTYTDRLKRIPRQVLRYGGTAPLWSIPIITLIQQQHISNTKHVKGSGLMSLKQKQTNVVSVKKNKPNEIYGYEQPIPACRSCGTQLRFELQILSSLLHVLNVDDFAPDTTTTTTSSSGNGGMDWGNICVYTCPNKRTKCQSTDAFCIVQDSIDHIHIPNSIINHTTTTTSTTTTNAITDQPQSAVPAVANASVVIPENSQFDPNDDDDGIVLEGEEYDNDYDDDDSVW